MDKVIDMIEKFLNNEYDPLDFSFDLPDLLIEEYDNMVRENKSVTEILNNELPDICAEYERGMNPSDMMDKVRREFNKIKSV